MPMVLPNASRPMKSARLVNVPARSARSFSSNAFDQRQHHAEHMLGDRLGIATGLIDDKDAALGTGLDVDGVVAGAVGRNDQQVRRFVQEFGAGVVVPRQFVPGRARLVGVRGGEDGSAPLRRALLLQHVEPHIAALAKISTKPCGRCGAT